MLGGGAGHKLDMINRIKANKAMRRKKVILYPIPNT